MLRQSCLDDILDSDWQNAFQAMKIKEDNPFARGLFQYRDNEILNENIIQKSLQTQNILPNNHEEIFANNNIQEMFTQISSDEGSKKSNKRQHSDTKNTEIQKLIKNEKQQGYSKAYRYKIKQKFKNLQDENAFLKKRIEELQSQIRQQELQLNRFKFSPPEKDFSIQDLSTEYISASDNLLESLKTKPLEYYQSSHLTDRQFHEYLNNFWDERGFSGSKKLKILNYHFNEILESIMKDSEKYLSLVYSKSQSYDKLVPLPGFQAINKVHLEIYTSEGNLWHKLKQFNKFLHPVSLQLNMHISQFTKKYEDILGCCNKIHQFLRQTYRVNLQVVKKRFEMQRCFNFHKYGKSMRKLRYQWFIWMKKLAQTQNKQNEQSKIQKKGSKKKKLSLSE